MKDFKGSALFSDTKDLVFIGRTLTDPIEIACQNESDEIMSDMNQTGVKGGRSRHRY
jgi:hypothetical protein